MDDALMQLVTQLQQEVESLCVRGVRAASSEQLSWFKHAHDRMAEMGAQYLAGKISNLLEAVEKNLIAAGDIVLMASSGAGENYIAVLQKVPLRLIRNIHSFF